MALGAYNRDGEILIENPNIVYSAGLVLNVPEKGEKTRDREIGKKGQRRRREIVCLGGEAASRVIFGNQHISLTVPT